MSDLKNPIHPRAAFFYRDFRFFVSARFLALCAYQMLAVAVGQYVYEITKSPLYLGYIGLSLFLPKITFALFAGHTADRFDRRRIIFFCRMTQFLVVVGIIFFYHFNLHSLWPLYGLLFLMGTANVYDGSASQAIVPQLVSTDHFGNAVAWSSSIMQIAFIVGPAIGGALYAVFGKAIWVFYVVALIRLASAFLIYLMHTRVEKLEKAEISWVSLLAGIRYVFKTRVILGAISLDLFAVLLGGAVALMPVFANDILKVGPMGLGILRAAPSVGAVMTAIVLAHLPPLKKSGTTMLFCVAIFGVATIFFGLSRSFIFSLFCLFILGSADMVSVVIRGILVQVRTPPAMRGRVSAVNLVFIGASNELGEFESGLTASWFGVIPSVILGGVGTLLVVLIWRWRFPELWDRHFPRIDG